MVKRSLKMLKQEQMTEGWDQGQERKVVGGVSGCSNLETKKESI